MNLSTAEKIKQYENIAEIGCYSIPWCGNGCILYNDCTRGCNIQELAKTKIKELQE